MGVLEGACVEAQTFPLGRTSDLTANDQAPLLWLADSHNILESLLLTSQVEWDRYGSEIILVSRS